MKKIIFNNRLISRISVAMLLVFGMILASCDFIDELPEANSIEDETPPTALFSFSSGVEIATFTEVLFSNLSNNATSFVWDLGNGTTSTETDPFVIYPGEGSFMVTLTVTDALGQTDTYSQTIELVEPEAPAVPDPTLLNPDFDRVNRMGSSNTCTCSGWINTDIGEQGESSSGNGSDVLKFDDREPDHVYQEFAVIPNANYRIEIPILFQSDIAMAEMPSQLEIRVLSGAGFVDGYTPTFFESTLDIPTSGFGYTTVAQVEEADNNLLVEVVSNPGDSQYRTFTFIFNAGANDSVALFIRGIGNAGPEDPEDFARYGYASGDEEIRADSVTITAINEQ